MIEKFANLVPSSVLGQSGSVFYSGRAAFSSPSPLYILGSNPGGSPEAQAGNTVERQIRTVLTEVPDEWSAYTDESWEGAPPGTYGLQPRVRHMLGRLGLDPRCVPSSNVLFVRSTREGTLNGNYEALASEAWPLHEAVIRDLGVKVILCFGQKAGGWVRRRVGATQLLGEFIEDNKRRWRSAAHANDSGLAVVTATHPSIADWTAPASDPTPLVQQVLDQSPAAA